MLKDKKYALIDMDGVLYDSMRYHTKAWHRLMSDLGLKTTREEFYLYEGMTGTDTINLIFKRELGYTVTSEKARELYARKARIFIGYGIKDVMPGAQLMIDTLMHAGIKCVLVTGSAQSSLISRLDDDFPGAFPHDMRVTALDVTHGKPDPEPYLKGLAMTGASPGEVFVIENAPLGVRAAKAAGLDTVAVTTGPIPRKAFEDEDADMIFDSMPQFAEQLPELLRAYTIRNEKNIPADRR